LLTLANRALEVADKLGATYADVRIVLQKQQNIETKDLTVADFSRGTVAGIGIRVLSGGWGFASTQLFTKAAVDKTVRLAVAAAKASRRCLDKEIVLAPEPRYRATWVSPHLIDPFTVSDDEKLSVLFDSARTMLGVKGVTLAKGYLNFVRENKLFLSMSGGQLYSHIDQTFIRSSCGIEANAKDANDQQKRSWPNSFGGQFENAGWEMVERWQLRENAQRIAEESVALLTAPQCPAGVMNAVIGASQIGLQIHESCGHPTELDRAIGQEANFAGRSFLTTGMRGSLRYGSDIVNLVADATAHSGLGGFAFDDEGVAAQCTPIVTNGIFTGYLSSRDTAPIIGLPRSGGCLRSEGPNFQPIIRMTNINLLPGTGGSLDDLIAQCGDGVLMECNKSWSIDDRRYNFQFGMEIGWLIKGGKLAGIVKNPSYSGITTEFWGSCIAIGGPETYVLWGVPNCGKGQPQQTMHTGHGAAPVLFRDLKVGIAHAG
jgi:TldD protein